MCWPSGEKRQVKTGACKVLFSNQNISQFHLETRSITGAYLVTREDHDGRLKLARPLLDRLWRVSFFVAATSTKMDLRTLEIMAFSSAVLARFTRAPAGRPSTWSIERFRSDILEAPEEEERYDHVMAMKGKVATRQGPASAFMLHSVFMYKQAAGRRKRGTMRNGTEYAQERTRRARGEGERTDQQLRAKKGSSNK